MYSAKNNNFEIFYDAQVFKVSGESYATVMKELHEKGKIALEIVLSKLLSFPRIPSYPTMAPEPSFKTTCISYVANIIPPDFTKNCNSIW